jgi:hypothetical protein
MLSEEDLNWLEEDEGDGDADLAKSMTRFFDSMADDEDKKKTEEKTPDTSPIVIVE